MSGHRAQVWRLSCGSFAVNGYMGTSEDYVTLTMAQCIGGETQPDLISISADMFVPIIRAVTLVSFVSPWPKEYSYEAVVSFVTERLIHGTEFLPVKLLGAVVRVDKDLHPGTINFYRDAELVGETSGWVA